MKQKLSDDPYDCPLIAVFVFVNAIKRSAFRRFQRAVSFHNYQILRNEANSRSVRARSFCRRDTAIGHLKK
jgi:hypothetical protein